MPIKNMTNGTARWMRLGVLRKGGPKPNDKQPGPDLGQNFRFTGNDPTVDEDWEAVFGGADKNGRLLIDGLAVRLPYQTVDANWQAWREHWVAGGLVIRCDGENHVLWRDEKGQYVTDDPRPCPGASCPAKPVGRLEVFVTDLCRMGTVTVQTTSKHDIMNLDMCLRAVALAFGDISRVPLRLSRVPRMISTPAGDGKRARREKWLLHLEADPAWVRYMLDAHGQAPAHLLPQVEMASLPSPLESVDVDEDTGEVIDAIAVGAVDVGVPDPTGHDDIEDAGEGEPDHWTPRLAGCKTVAEVEGLLADISQIEPLPRREHTVKLAYARIVELIARMLGNLDPTYSRTPNALATARAKLDALPADTPGRDLALDKVIDVEQRVAEAKKAEKVAA